MKNDYVEKAADARSKRLPPYVLLKPPTCAASVSPGRIIMQNLQALTADAWAVCSHLQEILLPQIASWSAMWVSGLIICYGLRKKEQLRARLATSGQVWTAHETAARELMSLELEDMQQQVDKMSNEELAQVAMRMIEVSSRPGCWGVRL